MEFHAIDSIMLSRSAWRCRSGFAREVLKLHQTRLMQVEYATDLVFRSVATLKPLYEQLVRESVLSVKAEQIATFLGDRIVPRLAQEVGSRFSTRIEGTCIKHRFGSASV